MMKKTDTRTLHQSYQARVRRVTHINMRFVVVLLLVGVAMSLYLSASPFKAQAISPDIVISEIRTRSGAAASDEFVEIFNHSGAPINIGGYKLQGAAAGTATWSDRATVPANTILNSGQRYLFANTGYTGATTPNQTYGTGISDNGGARLLRADGTTVVDTVGFNATAGAAEGTFLTPLTSSNTNQSYERKQAAGSAAVNALDTDNNANDFQLVTSNPQNTASSPTAADGEIRGEVLTADGQPVAGVVLYLSGTSSARTITDAQGNYRFENVETSGFYTVSPQRANYSFSPVQRSFSLSATKTDAVFTATANSNSTSNPLDSDLFFIRQQYLDFLGREPDAGGLAYWASELDKCGSDVPCLNSRRTAIAAAFFKELEYQRTGSFLYRIYKGALGRRVSFDEFSTDRASVIDGPALESSKSAYAEQFVRRADFQQRYSEATSAESFVDALISNIKQTSTADISNQRSSLIESYRSGADINQSRALALRAAIDSGAFTEAEYNPSFVLMEYFGYLKREPEEGGYQFWLNVLNNREPGNYNGMVCSFITSTEYQSRFAGYIAHSNRECSR